MCCPLPDAVTPGFPDAAGGRGGVDLLVRGPRAVLPVESKTGRSPRTPSVVLRAHEPKPMTEAPPEPCSDPRDTSAPIRLLPIRARTSGGATDFLPASALFAHRPTLRSTAGEDARCVEPTSATQTNCVHPHLARSRIAPLVAQRGRPTESKAPYGTFGGPGVSRHPRPLRRIDTGC